MTEAWRDDDSEDSPQELMVAEAADEYLQRVQQGESPDVEAYVQRYPEVGEVLRDVLPALQVMHGSRATKAARRGARSWAASSSALSARRAGSSPTSRAASPWPEWASPSSPTPGPCRPSPRDF